MNIYVDMDDVLCDTAGAYLRLLEQEFGKTVAFEDVFSFNLKESFNLTENEMAFLFSRAHEFDFVLAMEPIVGVKQILDMVHERGDTIAIVTGRHTSAYEASLEWFSTWSIPFHSFTMVDKYGWAGTDLARAIALEDLSNLDYDLAIEDSPKMASHLIENLDIPVLLFDRPWNRSYPSSEKCTRCIGWNEVAAALEIKRNH